MISVYLGPRFLALDGTHVGNTCLRGDGYRENKGRNGSCYRYTRESILQSLSQKRLAATQLSDGRERIHHEGFPFPHLSRIALL